MSEIALFSHHVSRPNGSYCSLPCFSRQNRREPRFFLSSCQVSHARMWITCRWSRQPFNRNFYFLSSVLVDCCHPARLLASVEGRPLPTELPQRAPPSSSSSGGGYEGGFGSSGGAGGEGRGLDKASMERLPGESDAEYVTRQKALRGQASARMRDKFGGGNRMQVRAECAAGSL